MRLCSLLLAAVLIAPLPAGAQSDAETVVAGLSQNEVSITARFSGSEIMVYGAVKRDAPPPLSPQLEVIVTVEGPLTPVIVRKKNRRYGLWINTEAVKIDAAPSFYAVATSGLLADVLSDTDDLRYKVTIPRAIRAVGIASEAEDAPSFTDALIRVRAEQGAYILSQHAVSLTQDTLIRTDVALPANLIEGTYKVRIFLTRGGHVVDVSENEIYVRKEGLERWLTNLAHNQPLAYGLLSLAIAALAGWGASEAFRVRRA